MTDEQKRQMVSAVLNAFIALVVSILVILGYTVNYPQPVMLGSGDIGVLSTNQKITTDRAGQTLFVLSGGKIDVNSGGTLEIDSGATETHAGTTTYTGLANLDGGIAVDTSNFTVNGTTGATVIAGALTLSSTTSLNGAANMNNYVINNIGNASTDFDASGGLTASGGFTGTVNTAAQTSITSLGTQASALNMGNSVINNIGNASTDFDLSGGLTVAGGITGTVNTAAQTSITSLGTLSGLNVSGNVTATNFSGTLTTAAQPNVTSVGTLPTATITNLTTTNITGTLATAAQTNVTSVGTLSGLNVSGNVTATNFSGTLSTAAQPNVTSVGTLPMATVTDLTTTNITGTLATAAQPNITSIGTQTNLTASNAITASTTLVLGTNSFTGAIKYGAQGSYTSGDAITHGFAITPTVCGPVGFTAATITATVTAITTTAFSLATGGNGGTIYWMCGQ